MSNITLLSLTFVAFLGLGSGLFTDDAKLGMLTLDLPLHIGDPVAVMSGKNGSVRYEEPEYFQTSSIQMGQRKRFVDEHPALMICGKINDWDDIEDESFGERLIRKAKRSMRVTINKITYYIFTWALQMHDTVESGMKIFDDYLFRNVCSKVTQDNSWVPFVLIMCGVVLRMLSLLYERF